VIVKVLPGAPALGLTLTSAAFCAVAALTDSTMAPAQTAATTVARGSVRITAGRLRKSRG